MHRVTGLLLVSALLLACSDDGGSSQDSSTTTDQGTVTDTGTTTGDNGVTPGDTGTPTDTGTPNETSTPTDTGTPADKGPASDAGAGTKPNSGTICPVPANTCPHTQDECIIVSGGATDKGMCLIKCTTMYAACPTANPATQKSICFLEFTGPPKELYCAYMCKYENKTYTCPTGSTCTKISNNTSVCVQQ